MLYSAFFNSVVNFRQHGNDIYIYIRHIYILYISSCMWKDLSRHLRHSAHNVLLFHFVYIYILFIFFCHHLHMECFPFSDLRIFLLSIPLCEWLTSTPFLLLFYYLFFCWIFAVALVWCLGIKFQK